MVPWPRHIDPWHKEQPDEVKEVFTLLCGFCSKCFSRPWPWQRYLLHDKLLIAASDFAIGVNGAERRVR